MKSFSYHQPKDIREASNLLGDNWQDALLNAGGTDLLGLIKHDIEKPDHLVNLKAVKDLDKVRYQEGKGLSIGALVKLNDLAAMDIVQNKYTVLAEALQETASPQLRNMGTIGGNLCQRPRCWYFRGDFDCLRKGGELCFAADGENKYHCISGGGPCFIVHPSDPAVALLALDASVTIAGKDREYTVPLHDFFVLPEDDVMRENILQPHEIVTRIHVPDLPSNTRSGYIKFKERDVWDFAVVSVAAVLRMGSERIEGGTMAFGGVAPKPWMEKTINDALNRMEVTDTNLDSLAQIAFTDALPLAQNGYKIPLVRNLIKRVIRTLNA
ncbi:MAG: xanthine dehydrogenase family protein subunit M [Caldithrix sp.]|nr:xanthine dehydrogenase family protein subunit M [Caldithrix sp.]